MRKALATLGLLAILAQPAVFAEELPMAEEDMGMMSKADENVIEGGVEESAESKTLNPIIALVAFPLRLTSAAVMAPIGALSGTISGGKDGYTRAVDYTFGRMDDVDESAAALMVPAGILSVPPSMAWGATYGMGKGFFTGLSNGFFWERMGDDNN